MEIKDIKILMVDDQTEMTDAIYRLLRSYGIKNENTKACINGEDALKELHSNSDYDLVLSDLNMPKMDGIELLKAVMADENLKEIVFVLMSSSVFTDPVERMYLSLGAKYVIEKGYFPDKIEEVLNFVVTTSR